MSKIFLFALILLTHDSFLTHTSAFTVSPQTRLLRGYDFHKKDGLRSSRRLPREGVSIARLKLQKKPEDSKDSTTSNSDLFSLFRESLQDAAEAQKSMFSSWAALPLFALPVWAAVVVFGLFMPSPEMVLETFSPAHAVFSAPWDAAPEVAKQAAQVLPFGTSQGGINLQDLANPQLDPSLFVPVCKFSDTFYRGAKNGVLALAGKDVYQEYAPLIAGSLLRVRLEFCVLESFVYESIIPFIKARGLSWVFPLRETLETFVAGVVFAVASNVVLIGSTKIISIAIFYSDFFIGLPIRLTFGFLNDRLVKSGAGKNPVGVALIAGTGVVRLVGQTTEVARKFIEFWDVFVGRYLLLTTFGYVVRPARLQAGTRVGPPRGQHARTDTEALITRLYLLDGLIRQLRGAAGRQVLKFLKFKGVLTIEKLGALWNALITASDSVPQ